MRGREEEEEGRDEGEERKIEKKCREGKMEIVARTTREGRAAPRRETRGGRGGKGAGGGEAYLLPAPHNC